MDVDQWKFSQEAILNQGYTVAINQLEPNIRARGNGSGYGEYRMSEITDRVQNTLFLRNLIPLTKLKVIIC